MAETKLKTPGFSSQSLVMIRRLFTEHARRHVIAYSISVVLMAAATALSAYLLKPILNSM